MIQELRLREPIYNKVLRWGLFGKKENLVWEMPRKIKRLVNGK